MKTAKNIDTDNYYYTQAFPTVKGGGHEQILFVTFASTPTEAKEKALNHLKEIGAKLDDGKIHLYHKNYKRDSRKMVDAGNYID